MTDKKRRTYTAEFKTVRISCHVLEVSHSAVIKNF